MRNKVLSVIFLVILIFVPFATIINRCFFDKETGNTAKMSPNAIVGEFLDDIPFRERLSQINTKLTRFASNNTYINSTQVILGKNDWLFFRETQSDYEGKECFSDAEKNQILFQILKQKDIFEKLGIELVLYIAPNKASIYPENMPDTILKRNSISKTEDLIEFLQENSDITIIYPKKELIDAKNIAEVYYKSDTHWNDVGGYVGTQAFVKEVLGIDDKLVEDKIVSHEGDRVGDLSKVANLSNVYTDKLLYEEVDTDLSIVPVNKKVYWIGDSFQVEIGKYLPKYVSEAFFVDDDAAYDFFEMYCAAPDIIVWEIIERDIEYYLSRMLINDAIISKLHFGSDNKCYYLSSDAFYVTDDGVCYYKDGEYVKNCLVEDGGFLYYFDETGYMLTESIKTIGENTYYFSDLGIALQGWLEKDGKWYYFGNDFCMVKDGWIQVKSGLWYYMLEDGSMLTDAYTPDGYYVDENGVWVQ